MIERGMKDVIVENSNEIMVVDGERRVGVNVAVSKEIFEQYRQGLRCLRCQGVQDEPFPKVCNQHFKWAGGEWKCGFKIKDDQLRYLENEHQGEKHYGPSELDDIDFEREDWKPRSGIWVPGDPL